MLAERLESIGVRGSAENGGALPFAATKESPGGDLLLLDEARGAHLRRGNPDLPIVSQAAAILPGAAGAFVERQRLVDDGIPAFENLDRLEGAVAVGDAERVVAV